MSDLQNPLFDEEKEFLERKKLEYERALRGDVDHIKDQSMMVGKVAAVGAGLAGGIWLITKAFSGRKKKRNRYVEDEEQDFDSDFGQEGFEPLGFDSNDDPDDEFGSHYYTAGNGKRYKSKFHRKSAADSARVFNEQTEQQAEHGHEADDLGFGSTPVRPATDSTDTTYGSHAQDSSPFDTEDFEDDPFQDLPYDDSRRLPTSHAFDGDEQRGPARSSGSGSGARMIGSALQAFLQSDTGKVLVAQVAAVALAMVTKKVSE
ncbi:MAG: hypothetical protein JWR44_3666, partial [Hymenobacter sp.]|nr:hypothetical protein [Hymenobacter sp.]